MIGGRFAPLTVMSNEDTDIDSMITTFNTAMTERASEILGKHRQKKNTSITAEILDLCDKRGELLTTVKHGKATTVQDRLGKCRTEERQIMNQWTAYCSERPIEIHQY